MTSSPARIPSRPSTTAGSNASHASGAPSSPCFGAEAGSVNGDSTLPIGVTSKRGWSTSDTQYGDAASWARFDEVEEMRRRPDRAEKRSLRVASAQAVALSGEIERNVDSAARLIDEAAASGAELIVFPELFLCGYDLSLLRRDPGRCDIEADDVRLDPVLDACRTGAITAVLSGSVLADEGGSRTISALVVDEHGGLSARYDKQHVWREERPLFRPGTGACVVDVRGWRLGLGICYDATFPEHARAAALAGADGYLCPSAFRERTILHPARALENTIYVVF